MKRLLFLLLFNSLCAADFAFAPPKELHLRNPRDFSLYADALALQAREGGLDFVIHDSNGSAISLKDGTVKGFLNTGGYNPGMRVGMNFLFADDRWNCDIVWTFLKITESKSVNAFGSQVLIPLWIIPTANSTNQSLHATWESNFNLLDGQIGKAFQISQFFIANPHFGGRIAFIDQHFAVDYGGFYGARRGAISHNDNNLAALGLRAGFQTEWELNPNFAFFGDCSGSILWGNFDIAQQLSQGTTLGYDLADQLNQNISNLELIVGFGWGRSFKKNQFRLDARIAYEFHQWWDMNQLRHVWSGGPGFANEVSSRGDFTLNGLSLRFQIDL